MSLDPENIESAKTMDVPAIKAAWAEWLAASNETEEAWKALTSAFYGPKTPRSRKNTKAANAAWIATLDRTDAARKAVAGLPDLEEVAAYEAEQAAIIEEANRQGGLF